MTVPAAASHVALKDAPSKAVEAALAARPTHVRLERCKLGAKVLALLAKNDALVSLEIFSSTLSAKAATPMFESAQWPALERLDLRGNKIADALPALAEHAPPRLRELRLGFTGLRAPHIEALHAIGTIERWTSGADDLGPSGVVAIAKSGWPLVALTMYRQRVGASGLELLAKTLPASLRSLVLYEADVGLRGLEHLASSSTLAPEEVRFRYDPIDTKGFAALVTSPFAASLTTLQVSQCRLDDGAIDALLGTALPSQLAVLDLSTNARMSPASMASFASTPWPLLRSLRIGGFAMGASGMTHLATATLPAIEELDLTYAELNDLAMDHLAAAPWLRGVKRLYLGTNDIGEAGIAALARSPHLGTIEELRLFQTPASRLGVVIPSESPLARAKLVTTFTQ